MGAMTKTHSSNGAGIRKFKAASRSENSTDSALSRSVMSIRTKGLINAKEFDLLCEKVAALPRRFGLAPSWEKEYGGDRSKRKAARAAMFYDIDTRNGPERGTIGLKQFLAWHPKQTRTRNSVTSCSRAWTITTQALSRSANFLVGLWRIRKGKSNTIAQQTSDNSWKTDGWATCGIFCKLAWAGDGRIGILNTV